MRYLVAIAGVVLLPAVAQGQTVAVDVQSTDGTASVGRLQVYTTTSVGAIGNISVLQSRLQFGSAGYFRLPNYASDPASPQAGDLYYDTAGAQMRLYTTAWNALVSTAGTQTIGGTKTFSGTTNFAGGSTYYVDANGNANFLELKTGASGALRIANDGVGTLTRLSLTSGSTTANTLNVTSSANAPVTLNVTGNSVQTGALIQASATSLTTGTFFEATVNSAMTTGDILYIHDNAGTPATKLRLTAGGNFSVSGTISTSGSATTQLSAVTSYGATQGVTALYGKASATANGSAWPASAFSGVYGEAGDSTAQYHAGVLGYQIGTGSNSGGVVGVYSSVIWGGLGYTDGTGTQYAGYFSGNLKVTGSLTKGSGSFLIDHPDDPWNKTLRHFFVESPESLCLYRGLVELDQCGVGDAALPAYFRGLTREDEATVLLTPVGSPFEVGYEWNEDFTRIRVFGNAGRRVSYLVLADRDDPTFRALRKPVEQEKGAGRDCLQGELLYRSIESK